MNNFLTIHDVKSIVITVHKEPLKSGAYTIDFTFKGNNGLTEVTTFSATELTIKTDVTN